MSLSESLRYYYNKGKEKLAIIGYKKFRKSISIDLKKFFEGKTGLEIGGPSDIFCSDSLIPVYDWAGQIDSCNFSRKTIWTNQQDNKKYSNYAKKINTEYICDATDLSPIGNDKYDFLVASHVIEHIANPIKAIQEWQRVIKDGGILLLIIPHKEGTFDHLRPTTELNHVIKDFEDNTREDDLSHLAEIIEFHDLSRDPGAGTGDEFYTRSKDNYQNRGLHHHVFTTDSAIRLFDYLDIEILNVRTSLPFNIIIAGRINKECLGMHEINEMFLDKNAVWWKESCFEEI